MALTCRDVVIGLQQIQLSDVDKTTWSEVLLKSALNQAIGLLLLVRPDASARRIIHTCVAGTEQSLSSGYARLLKVIRNVTGASNTPGRAIRMVSMHDLDRGDPNWHSTTQSTIAHEYVFDEQNPTTFWLYPPIQAGTKVQIEASESLPAITSLEDDFPLDSVFAQPVKELMLYLILSDTQGSTNHYNLAMNMLDRKSVTDTRVNPANDGKAGS